MTNSSEIIAVLRRYQSVFSNRRTIEPEGWVIYAEALSDIPAGVVKMAMDKLVLTSDWFPSVKEIRGAAEGLVRHSNGTGLPTPDEAWAEAIKLAKRYDVGAEWPYSYPEIRDSIQAFGGKLAFYDIPAGGEGTARAQFKKCYESVLAEKRDRAANDAVLGDDTASLPPAVRAMIGRWGA